MIQLEFWDEEAGLVISHIPAGKTPEIPGVGDFVDVPESANPGMVASVKVTARHFYYSPVKQLIRVRLYCQEAGSAG